ncbi:MAG TPA: hypothetical protein VFI71_00250, partial [Pyrinomonadaceae bacterium]|nr:hypothetical protein [Pyrinomonadaceae bacterium]
MAQNREQRYATAADMRKALHLAEQASTVVERGEAQTVLFPPPPKTVAIPTQTVPRQATVTPTGETTVVRPRGSGPGMRVFPIAIAAGVLLLVVCGVFGFYALQKRSNSMVQIAAETPSPLGGPVTTPTPESTATPSPEAKVEEAPVAVPKKSPREEAKKTPERAPQEPRGEGEGHERDVRVDPPDIPEPPDVERPDRQRRPNVRVTRDGMVIRKLPDGSQIITRPDGMTVMITKDGKRQVLSPPRPNRRREVPAPAPSPQ